jgi:hypothetical protein
VHETLYHFQKPRDETEANAWLQNFLVRYNAMDHRSGAQSRIEDWLQHLPAEGVRAVCSWGCLTKGATKYAKALTMVAEMV